MYSNSLSHRIKRLIEAENIIITTLFLLFLGVTIKTWGLGPETAILWISVFYLLFAISITILEIEFDLEFLVTIVTITILGYLVANSTFWILMIFLCVLIMVIKIKEGKRQEISRLIKNIGNLIEATFGDLFGPLILLSTVAFAIAYYPFAINWTEIAYIIMLILVEVFLYLLVKNKEEIASGRIDIVAPLLLFTITVLILVIYYLGFIEIVFIVIGLSFLLYSVIKIASVRDD